ncbi:NAD(P)-binding protein [Hesseltinella vesiculosa]|uniref:Probable quinone oxidoreductase n=1 Tax=Hesseltinella vesiculosa TaxID=101127 RepID=A0A1X2G332_9FUNG|nr:NAD(P)-binding protein [Hesseltinella vesiculosa]
MLRSFLTKQVHFGLYNTSTILQRTMSTVPTMKAVVVKENGGRDKLIYEDVPRPSATLGNVVIKNQFIGKTLSCSFFLSSGEVVELGEGVTDFKIGDRVVHMGGNGYAEFSEVSATSVEKITHDVSYETAAAGALQGLTALTMVKSGYPVAKDDYILVHAAAGGVGLLLCQLGKHLGAKVIGTASTDEKCQLAKENGATYTINSKTEDIVARVNEITGGLGCHAVLDGVGKATFEVSMQCARRLGTMISFGNASGAVDPISIAILAQKNLKLMRPTLYNYMATREESRYWYDELFKLVEQGVLKFHVHKVYDLKDAAQAQQDLEGRITTGKLLLRP